MRYRLMMLVFLVCQSVHAFAEIKPGPPEGAKCVTALGDAGTSIRRTDGTWSCKLPSIAAVQGPTVAGPANPAGLTPIGAPAQSIFPTCPTGWSVSLKAGRDICTAPVPTPACPPGKLLTQDQDGLRDVCKEPTAAAAPRPAS